MSLKITGLGGCREVGRSSFLIEADGARLMLDRGLKILPQQIEYPLDVHTKLDALIISHAHLDHSGDLPRLFKNNNPVCYMTPPTFEIAELLWHDSLKIAGIEGIDARFNKADIKRTRKYTFPIPYGSEFEIARNTWLELFDAGHIVGSALTKLTFNEKTLLYTGDYKVIETRLLKKAEIRKVGNVDYVITEGTYGGEDHPDRREVEREFVEACLEVVDNGGIAIVPAFAVGRSHEIIDVLYEYKVKCPVYLDGMAQKAARITLKYSNFLKAPKKLSKALKKAIWIRHDGDRKKAIKEPGIIVSTAGMCDGGPVLFYIRRLANDPKNAIFLTGYQVEGTQGRRLLEEGRITIDSEEIEPKCKVQKFDFSAHPGQSEMLKALSIWNPEKIFIVHGEPEKLDVFEQKIEEELGIEAEILELGKMVKVD